MWFNFLDRTLNVLGYSRKKTGGVEDILFGKAPVEYFIFLPLEIPGKTKLHSWKFYKVVLNPLKIPRSKTKCPGISTLFFLGHPWKLQLTPGNFTCSFFDTPGNSISPLPLFFFFFWNCPLNIQVICIRWLRCEWHTGELFYYQWPGFHHLIWEGSIFF